MWVKRMPFYEWVLTRRVTDSPRGDLIYDIKKDERFTTADNEASIEAYLIRRHACSEAIEAFRKLWKEYKRKCLRKISKDG